VGFLDEQLLRQVLCTYPAQKHCHPSQSYCIERPMLPVQAAANGDGGCAWSADAVRRCRGGRALPAV
jgi:hypothetical protein